MKKKKNNNKKTTTKNKRTTQTNKQTNKKKKKHKKPQKNQKLKNFSLPSAESAQRAVKKVNTYKHKLNHMKDKTLVNLM